MSMHAEIQGFRYLSALKRHHLKEGSKGEAEERWRGDGEGWSVGEIEGVGYEVGGSFRG